MSLRSVLLGVCAALSPITAQALPDQFTQSGFVTDARNVPLQGVQTLRVLIHDRENPRGAERLFEESHRVEFDQGWYVVQVGSVENLPPELFTRDSLYFSVVINDGEEILPRRPLGKVPATFIADVAVNVIGDIEPNTIRVNGDIVIDEEGRWVGPPVGLRGPAGPPGDLGPAGPAGPRGPAGAAGAGGSPDTPQQILDKLVTVDGRTSSLDADRLDGIDSAEFVRTAEQILTLLRTVDGQNSGVDSDRLDGIDSSEFIRTTAQLLALLRTGDGEGSGLDADRLDGLDSTSFFQNGAQVLEALRREDGPDSRLDADRLDSLDSTQFMRTDADTGTAGDLSTDGILTADALRIRDDGRITVGVDEPRAAVDIEGAVRANGLILSPQAAAPEAPQTGHLYYDSEERALRLFDGEEWVTFGSAPPDPDALRIENYVDTVLSEGPSAYWKLDDEVGAALDSSGRGRHGTYEGGVRRAVTGRVGPATDFVEQGYIDTSVGWNDLTSQGTRVTVTAIIKTPDNYTQVSARPYASRHHVWSTFAYWQGMSVGRIGGVDGVHIWSFHDGSNEYIVNMAAPPGQWVHVAWVYRGQQFCGYLNGIESCVNAPLPIQRGGNRLFNIGRFHQDRTFPPPYPAEIQHVAVYDRALTGDQIRNQVAAMMGNDQLDGSGRDQAAPTCRHILEGNPALAGEDGTYWINPYSADPQDAVQTYCDMTTDGGGWTLAAYSREGSGGGADCPPRERRNLYPMNEGGGDFRPDRQNQAASLPAVSIARLSSDMLLARSDRVGYSGNIQGGTVATKIRIPDSSIVTLDNASNQSGGDRGQCVRAQITTILGPDATGAERYIFDRALMTSWSDTYPTSYGVSGSNQCMGNTSGPAYATSFTGRNAPQRYCWPHDAQGGAYSYWHRGWYDATQDNRGGAVAIYFR